MHVKDLDRDGRTELDRIAPTGHSNGSPREEIDPSNGHQLFHTTAHIEVHRIPIGSSPSPSFAGVPFRAPKTPGTNGSSETAREADGEGDKPEPSAEKRSFAYGVAHDLKEPLRVIQGHLQFLERKAGDSLGDEETKHLDHARKSTQEAVDLVGTLIDHARAGKKHREESVDLNAVVEDAQSNLQAVVEDASAQIRIDDLPEVVGDPEQLCRVFQNLVHNALKYRGDRPARIHVAHESSTETHRFSVIDNGLGLSSTARQDLFEMFSNTSRDTPNGGNGMGLALCREIVENHGGRIWVESEVGEGSTFHFTIAKRPTRVRVPS